MLTPSDESSVHDTTGSRVAAGIDHPRKRAMLAALARTANVSASCRATGVGRQTHYDWMDSDPGYRAGVAIAKEEAIEVLEAAARRRALVGSDTLLIFLLKAARPDVYRERHEVKTEATIRWAEVLASLPEHPTPARLPLPKEN